MGKGKKSWTRNAKGFGSPEFAALSQTSAEDLDIETIFAEVRYDALDILLPKDALIDSSSLKDILIPKILEQMLSAGISEENAKNVIDDSLGVFVRTTSNIEDDRAQKDVRRILHNLNHQLIQRRREVKRSSPVPSAVSIDRTEPAPKDDDTAGKVSIDTNVSKEQQKKAVRSLRELRRRKKAALDEENFYYNPSASEEEFTIEERKEKTREEERKRTLKEMQSGLADWKEQTLQWSDVRSGVPTEASPLSSYTAPGVTGAGEEGSDTLSPKVNQAYLSDRADRTSEQLKLATKRTKFLREQTGLSHVEALKENKDFYAVRESIRDVRKRLNVLLKQDASRERDENIQALRNELASKLITFRTSMKAGEIANPREEDTKEKVSDDEVSKEVRIGGLYRVYVDGSEHEVKVYRLPGAGLAAVSYTDKGIEKTLTLDVDTLKPIEATKEMPTYIPVSVFTRDGADIGGNLRILSDEEMQTQSEEYAQATLPLLAHREPISVALPSVFRLLISKGYSQDQLQSAYTEKLEGLVEDIKATENVIAFKNATKRGLGGEELELKTKRAAFAKAVGSLLEEITAESKAGDTPEDSPEKDEKGKALDTEDTEKLSTREERHMLRTHWKESQRVYEAEYSAYLKAQEEKNSTTTRGKKILSSLAFWKKDQQPESLVTAERAFRVAEAAYAGDLEKVFSKRNRAFVENFPKYYDAQETMRAMLANRFVIQSEERKIALEEKMLDTLPKKKLFVSLRESIKKHPQAVRLVAWSAVGGISYVTGGVVPALVAMGSVAAKEAILLELKKVGVTLGYGSAGAVLGAGVGAIAYRGEVNYRATERDRAHVRVERSYDSKNLLALRRAFGKYERKYRLAKKQRGKFIAGGALFGTALGLAVGGSASAEVVTEPVSSPGIPTEVPVLRGAAEVISADTASIPIPEKVATVPVAEAPKVTLDTQTTVVVPQTLGKDTAPLPQVSDTSPYIDSSLKTGSERSTASGETTLFKTEKKIVDPLPQDTLVETPKTEPPPTVFKAPEVSESNIIVIPDGEDSGYEDTRIEEEAATEELLEADMEHTIKQGDTISSVLCDLYAAHPELLPEMHDRDELLEYFERQLHALEYDAPDTHESLLEQMGVSSGDIDHVAVGETIHMEPLFEYLRGTGH